MDFLKSLFEFFKNVFSKTTNTSAGTVNIETSSDITEESSDTDVDIVSQISPEENVDDIIDDSSTEDNDETVADELNDKENNQTDDSSIISAVSDVSLTANSKYKNIVVFLLAGHCSSTPGKKSPDSSLLEWQYNRTIVSGIEKELDKLGISYWNVHPEDDFVYKTKGTCSSLDSRDLVLRKNRINSKYTAVKKQGKKAFLLEVHVNAAGSGKWNNATGWCCYTTKGLNNSDKLADCLYDAAELILKPLGKTLRTDMSDGDRDQESDFYVIKKANCVGTLTENFFMDNKEDILFLLSEEGKNAIVDIHIKGTLKYIEKYC